MAGMTAEERASHIQMIGFGSIGQSSRVQKYLANQIRQAEAAARRKALEDAANYLDLWAEKIPVGDTKFDYALMLANKIRKLMDNPNA